MIALRVLRLLGHGTTILFVVIGLVAAINALVRLKAQINAITSALDAGHNTASGNNLLIPTVMLIIGEIMIAAFSVHKLAVILRPSSGYKTKCSSRTIQFILFDAGFWIWTLASAIAMNIVGGSQGIKLHVPDNIIGFSTWDLSIPSTYWGDLFVVLMMVSPWPILGCSLFTIMLDEVGSEMEDLATLISTYNRGEHELAMLRTAASSVNDKVKPMEVEV